MTTEDPTRLIELVEAARAEADRLGAPARRIATRLAETLTEAHALRARGGKPDEGLRPDQLTTDNDR